MYHLSAPHHVRGGLVAFLVMALLPVSGSVQAQVVEARRLDELNDAVQTEIRFVEAESLDAARPLLAQLEELRDDVAYMRVALRRGQTIEDWECRRAEGRLLGLREAVRRFDMRAHDRGLVEGGPEIAIGTELHLLLPDRLDAPTRGGQVWFDAITLTEPANDRAMIPAGSVVRGSMRRVDHGSRTDGRDGLLVALREITIHGSIYAVNIQVIEARAADGTAIAVESSENASILTGDGGALDLARGAVLRVRFESPLELSTAER